MEGTEAKVTITYTTEDADLWKEFERLVRSNAFPLHSLAWSSPQATERIIPDLTPVFVPYSPDTAPVKAPVALHQPPFLNVYLVNALPDIESYRSEGGIKDRVKEWKDGLAARESKEWLIIYVPKRPPPDTMDSSPDHPGRRASTIPDGPANPHGLYASHTASTGFLSTMRSAASTAPTTNFDRLRSDFNSDKRERCILVPLGPDRPQDSDAWSAVASALKEGILSGFRERVQSSQEVVRKLDGQRQRPGWNYCTFFLTKENIALDYEAMGLYEEGLLVYDELDASFFQVQKDRSLHWFRTFGGTDEGDDAGEIFDASRKDYRSRILHNTVSLFDLQVYLFARQCALLSRVGRERDACERARAFVLGFSRTVRAYRKSLPPHFVEAWIFAAARQVLRRTHERLPEREREDAPILALRTDLLHTCRKQLDKLGVSHGLLPCAPPFTVYLDNAITGMIEESSAVQAPDGTLPPMSPMEKHIGVAELQGGLSSPQAFDRLYLTLTNETFAGYMDLSRDKLLWQLDADVAALHLHRRQHAEALPILEKLCQRYARAGWKAMETLLRQQLATCQRALHLDAPYGETCLTLLADADGVSPEQKQDLVSDVISLSRSLDDHERPFEPLFEASYLDPSADWADGEREGGGREVSVRVCIQNHLPLPFPYSDLTMRLIGGEVNDLTFRHIPAHAESGPEGSDSPAQGLLQPGKNIVTLGCDHPVAGNYVVDTLGMRCGALRFATSFLHGHRKRVFRISPQASPISLDISLDTRTQGHLPGAAGTQWLLLRIQTLGTSLSGLATLGGLLEGATGNGLALPPTTTTTIHVAEVMGQEGEERFDSSPPPSSVLALSRRGSSAPGNSSFLSEADAADTSTHPVLRMTPLSDEISLMTDQPILCTVVDEEVAGAVSGAGGSSDFGGGDDTTWETLRRAPSTLLEEIACLLPERTSPHRVILLRVPFVCRIHAPSVKVKATLEYISGGDAASTSPLTTSAGHGITVTPPPAQPLTLRGIHTVDLASVLSIRSTSRWYGGEGIIVRTTVTSEAEHPVRLTAASLSLSSSSSSSPSTSPRMSGPSSPWRIVYGGGLTTTSTHGVILFPGESYAFVHQLERVRPFHPDDPEVEAESEGGGPHLRVEYTFLTEEIMSKLSALLEARLTAAGLAPHAIYILEHVQARVLRFCDIGQLGLTGKLDLRRIPQEAFVSAFLHEAEGTKGRILQTLREAIEEEPVIELLGPGEGEERGRRVIQERIHLPSRPQSLTIIELRQQEEGLGEDGTVMIEQPAPFTLVVRHRRQRVPGAARGDGDGEGEGDTRLFLEVEEDREHWLVCGKKRMHLTLKEGETWSCTVTLIPLKTGSLAVPRVRVSQVGGGREEAQASGVKVRVISQATILPKERGASFFLERV